MTSRHVNCATEVAVFTIDGQRPRRIPPQPLKLLDGQGVDLRLTPQPLVFERTLEEFVEAGGWVNTVPMDLE